jgi:hypothetical protein
MQSVPFTPLDPPKNRPRLTLTCLPPTLSIDSVTIFQSVSESKFLLHLAQAISTYKNLVFLGGSPSRHMHIFQIGIVGPGLKNQDFRVDVLGKATCDHTSRRSSTVPVNHVQSNPSSTKAGAQHTRR